MQYPRFFTILFLLAIPACKPAPLAPPAPVAASQVIAPLPRPYLLHIPGISGESIVDHTFVRGLRAARLDADIEIYDWTEHDPGVPALQALTRNKQEARKISDKLIARYRADPRIAIYLTSHSGGAGPAAWALEGLPPDVQIRRALYLAPALSPTYDLTKSLSHVADKAYVFWSDQDQIILSAGTRVFGTIDGQYTDSAGYVSFTRPPAGDPAQYAKLVQFPYDRSWVRYQHPGDHIGPMATPFAQFILAPLIESGKLPPVARAATTQSTSSR